MAFVKFYLNCEFYNGLKWKLLLITETSFTFIKIWTANKTQELETAFFVFVSSFFPIRFSGICLQAASLVFNRGAVFDILQQSILITNRGRLKIRESLLVSCNYNSIKLTVTTGTASSSVHCLPIIVRTELQTSQWSTKQNRNKYTKPLIQHKAVCELIDTFMTIQFNFL